MGMFDSVYVECPHCGEKVEFQSKAGDCYLATIDQEEVPIEIANDIVGDTIYCERCDGRFTLHILTKLPPRTVPIIGVKD